MWWQVVKVQRPILVGGLGLTAALWLLDSWQHWVGNISALGAIAAVGAGVWWWRQQTPVDLPDLKAQVPLDRTTVEQSLTTLHALLEQFAAETATAPRGDAVESQLTQLQQQSHQMGNELERSEFRLVILGGKGTGKTAIADYLRTSEIAASLFTLCIQELPSLFDYTTPADLDTTQIWQQVSRADLVLFTTTSDLTASEYQVIQRLHGQQRTVLVLNKQDQYLPVDRSLILQQLQQRLRPLLTTADIVPITAVPGLMKVRHHQPNGSVREWLEQPAPEIQVLSDRLQQILTQEGQQLQWASTLRGVMTLQAEAKAGLNQVRRSRALPLIEQFQWIAAATAFANPLPTLDLLATAAITTQMILELGAIYRQPFSRAQAEAIASTLAGLLFKLGLVELTTQGISTVLKSNAVTFVAGGLLQGVSAAYLTHLAGLGLVAYFQEQDPTHSATTQPLLLERLTQLLRQLFQQQQQSSLWRSLVQQGVSRLLPEGNGAIHLPQTLGVSVPQPEAQGS